MRLLSLATFFVVSLIKGNEAVTRTDSPASEEQLTAAVANIERLIPSFSPDLLEGVIKQDGSLSVTFVPKAQQIALIAASLAYLVGSTVPHLVQESDATTSYRMTTTDNPFTFNKLSFQVPRWLLDSRTFGEEISKSFSFPFPSQSFSLTKRSLMAQPDKRVTQQDKGLSDYAPYIEQAYRLARDVQSAKGNVKLMEEIVTNFFTNLKNQTLKHSEHNEKLPKRTIADGASAFENGPKTNGTALSGGHHSNGDSQPSQEENTSQGRFNGGSQHLGAGGGGSQGGFGGGGSPGGSSQGHSGRSGSQGGGFGKSGSQGGFGGSQSGNSQGGFGGGGSQGGFGGGGSQGGFGGGGSQGGFGGGGSQGGFGGGGSQGGGFGKSGFQGGESRDQYGLERLRGGGERTGGSGGGLPEGLMGLGDVAGMIRGKEEGAKSVVPPRQLSEKEEGLKRAAKILEDFLASEEFMEKAIEENYLLAARAFLRSLSEKVQTSLMDGLQKLSPEKNDSKYLEYVKEHPIEDSSMSAGLLLFRLHQVLNLSSAERGLLVAKSTTSTSRPPATTPPLSVAGGSEYFRKLMKLKPFNPAPLPTQEEVDEVMLQVEKDLKHTFKLPLKFFADLRNM